MSGKLTYNKQGLKYSPFFKLRVMKASELRIGNYVTDCDGILIYTVARVETIEYADWNDGNDFNVYVLESGTKDRYLEGDFEPIPLTEEWLLKFGFKKFGSIDIPRTISYELNGWSIFPPNSFCDFQEGFGFMWYKPFKDESVESARVIMKYVHQLQNLYFALIDEELTLKSE